jgi:hypothetical protein
LYNDQRSIHLFLISESGRQDCSTNEQAGQPCGRRPDAAAKVLNSSPCPDPPQKPTIIPSASLGVAQNLLSSTNRRRLECKKVAERHGRNGCFGGRCRVVGVRSSATGI